LIAEALTAREDSKKLAVQEIMCNSKYRRTHFRLAPNGTVSKRGVTTPKAHTKIRLVLYCVFLWLLSK
jgi:hypothetical protein